MNRYLCGAALLAVVLAGCGGETDGYGNPKPSGRGEVSGVVFDEFGAVVRGADISYDATAGGEPVRTVSNSSGAYRLTGVASHRNGIDLLIRATATIDGVAYSGQNLVRMFDSERFRNMNIGVYPTNRQASIRGSVGTLSGNFVRGARVFARPVDASTPTSAYAVSDVNGNYEIKGLMSGMAYNLVCNTTGSDSDRRSNVTLRAGERRVVDFRLDNSNSPLLPAPQNVRATAWTSPREVTRDREMAKAHHAIKNLLKPNRKAVVTRDAANGYPIEIDLDWNNYSADSHLGFGVYRGPGAQQLQAEDLVRDPLAVFYADQDSSLQENQDYYYALTALSTDYDGTNGESNLSNWAAAQTMGALTNDRVEGSTLRWNAVLGAMEYKAYLFRVYPTVVDQLAYESPWSPATNVNLSGAPLTPGNTYYYLIVARRNEGEAFSLSRIGTYQR